MDRTTWRQRDTMAVPVRRADPPPSGGRVSGDGVLSEHPRVRPNLPTLDPEKRMAQVKLGALCWNQYTDWASLLEAGVRADRLGEDTLWT